MNETRKKFYDDQRNWYLSTDPARAVGWRNQEALDKRFHTTIAHLSNNDFEEHVYNILDVGCGCSLNLLRYINIDPHYYVGIDCNHESLDLASTTWSIPYCEYYDPELKHQLLYDEYLDKVVDISFDIILVQGVYQEFSSIRDIKEHVKKLSTMLSDRGELLIMTPANRLLDAEGKSVLKISPYDAISILEETGLSYELALGELGEHLIMRCYKEA